MAIYLVQHGLSLPREVDPEKGLSQDGIEGVERIAAVAKNYNVAVSLIQHSGKKRALQTAEIFAAALTPGRAPEARNGLDPLEDVTAMAHTLQGADNVMLVGHLPFMERLTAYLVTRSADLTVFKFQNGGLLCLDQDPDTNSWFIKWALMPQIG